jgi:CRISPR associated protein Cas1
MGLSSSAAVGFGCRIGPSLARWKRLGAEGEAGQTYFAVFNHLVRGEKPMLAFKGRSWRPPLDAINALLSFIYALLTTDLRSKTYSGAAVVVPPCRRCCARGSRLSIHFQLF